MHIGLIGGIGPAATDFYYRRLIAGYALMQEEGHGGDGAGLELTIVHADTGTLLGNMARGDGAAQVAIYARLTRRLQAAGAGCVVVTSVSVHFCIGAFKAVSVLPVVDIVEAVGRAVAARGLRRVGILGTRTVMGSRFYGGLPGVEVLAPRGAALDAVHEAYVGMAASGVVTAGQRAVFEAAALALLAEGAEAIMLGGTDLALAFDGGDARFPLVDCAGIHVDAVLGLVR